MNDQEFPIDHYLAGLVRCLDTIKYQDNNYDRHERVKNLKYTYSEAAKFLAQTLQQGTLKMSPKEFEGALRTVTRMVVYGWAKVSPQLMVALTIHYMYAVVLDDSILLEGSNDLHLAMMSFFEDLSQGRQQKHPWWRLMNEHMPQVLEHYESFCAFNILRSTFDCKGPPELSILNLGQLKRLGAPANS